MARPVATSAAVRGQEEHLEAARQWPVAGNRCDADAAGATVSSAQLPADGPKPAPALSQQSTAPSTATSTTTSSETSTATRVVPSGPSLREQHLEKTPAPALQVQQASVAVASQREALPVAPPTESRESVTSDSSQNESGSPKAPAIQVLGGTAPGRFQQNAPIQVVPVLQLQAAPAVGPPNPARLLSGTPMLQAQQAGTSGQLQPMPQFRGVPASLVYQINQGLPPYEVNPRFQQMGLYAYPQNMAPIQMVVYSAPPEETSVPMNDDSDMSFVGLCALVAALGLLTSLLLFLFVFRLSLLARGKDETTTQTETRILIVLPQFKRRRIGEALPLYGSEEPSASTDVEPATAPMLAESTRVLDSEGSEVSTNDTSAATSKETARSQAMVGEPR